MNLKLTKSAETKIISLLPAGSFLRIRIAGGGCSGLTYNLSIEKAEPGNSDIKIVESGITIVIDKKSSFFLDGVEIDFSDGLNGKGFEFNNPRAKKTCGCGSSFQF
jgi:iron-sulfur cluster assembly protein